jgi:UDP-N-acetyl-D-glucosamine dehydrogenase
VTKVRAVTRSYTDDGFAGLRAAFEARTACVGVVGLGYVGLPLIAAFGRSGFRCVGIDLDRRKCESLASGISYAPDVSDESIRYLLDNRLLLPSSDYADLAAADAIVVCVPTPVYRDKRPDLGHVRQAAEAIGGILRPGQLVVLESTCYPGTTEELLRPVLEGESGLRAGVNFLLAFSPERIDPGNRDFSISNTPKVVGGIDSRSTELAGCLYAQIVQQVVAVSSTREAEMSKLIENTFRHVNIALANELALIAECLGVDFWEAMRAASSKPFGFMTFYPGPGVGGHCIPVDPHYLAWKAKERELAIQLIDTAEQINASMPYRVVARVVEEINDRGLSVKGARILVLGVSYKGGIGDTRESPALRIIEALEARGAAVTYYDPYVPELKTVRGVARSVPLTRELLASQACAVLVTDHSYDLDFILKWCPLLIDTRNAVKSDAPNCVRLWAKNGHNGHSGRVVPDEPSLAYVRYDSGPENGAHQHDSGAGKGAQQYLPFPTDAQPRAEENPAWAGLLAVAPEGW